MSKRHCARLGIGSVFCLVPIAICLPLFGQQPFASEPPSVDSSQEADASVHDEMIALEFRDQAWLPALQWLARELNLNLDWQTLPEGEFSLSSARKHTLEEAEDLINMQLLARGYTLLKRADVLRVVPLKEVDVTLVPRVEPVDLDALSQHQFVRVSFSLEWMIAEEAAEEFKPLLSPFGQLTAMRATNRLEAMDAVVNLREMHRLLLQAESEDTRRERVAEFRLKYRTAEEVAVKIRQLLGLPPDTTPAAPSQLDIEQAKFKVEAVKQMGSGAKDLLKEKRPDVFLAVNEKENSILVNAPPNKIEIVRQTIEAIDRPLPDHESTWETISKVKVHDIVGFDPRAVTSLLTSLQTSGNLSKEVRIQQDAAYNRLIAFASPEDQLTIASVIDSFRAKVRGAVVLPLNSLEADYAVKAVQTILKNPQRPSAVQGVASDGTFQIEADPDHSRLILWGTPEEVKEVQEFLKSLGDDPAQRDETERSKIQVLELRGIDAAPVLKRVAEVWEDLSDSPLIVQPSDGTESGNSDSPNADTPNANTPNADTPNADTPNADTPNADTPNADTPNADKPATRTGKDATAGWDLQNIPSRLADLPAPSPSGGIPIKLVSSGKADADQSPPVRILFGEDDELIILSRDPVAAKTAKQLIRSMIPDEAPINTITLKHAQAFAVRRQMEEMLERYWNTGAVAKLAKPTKPIKIDVDSRTNRLIIQNASSIQWKRIKQFVEVLDQPVSTNDRLARQQRVYRFQYRKANEVANVIKEVYRDLLSINDRAFYSGSSGRGGAGYNQNLAATQNNPEYQGLLSIGVDTQAELLVLSAPGYLIDEITDLAKSMDTPQDAASLGITTFAVGGRESESRRGFSRILEK